MYVCNSYRRLCYHTQFSVPLLAPLTYTYPIICKYTEKNELLAFTVEPVYYGHLGTSQKCPDYQGVLIFQVSLHDNVSFGTTARCLDYAGVHIFKGPD